MGAFTFIPAWVIQDLIVFLVALITVFFIIRKEEHPEVILLEMVCFSFLYAVVYENFATLMGWYGYGRSLVMVGNVPLSVPVVEYLVVYSTLRLLKDTGIPTWRKPFLVGLAGMLFDFTLDPVAIKMIYSGREGAIGRWTWFPNPTDVQIYGEPVYNFTGWVMICGYAAALLLLGRWWYKKSHYNRAVGFLYPPLSMIAALGVLVSPQTRFFLWLEPIFQKGGVGEWIMLAFWFAVPIVLLLASLGGGLRRGAVKHAYTPADDLPALLVLAGLPVVNAISALAYGFFEVAWLVALFSVILVLVVLYVFLHGRKKALTTKTSVSASGS